MERIVALPDIHYPLHSRVAMACVDKFLADFRPTTLIYSGDTLNLSYISRHEKDNKRGGENERILKDYAGVNEMIARHRRLARNPRVIYMIGNHEDWINDYINQHPEMEGSIEIEKCIKGVDKFIPLNKTFKAGKLFYLHGIYTVEHNAKKTVESYKRNIVYCHTHSIQLYTSISPIDRADYHTAKSIGCLCDKNPKYMESKPSAWVHGFHVAYVQDNGLFSDYQVVINRGQFIWGGKLYKI